MFYMLKKISKEDQQNQCDWDGCDEVATHLFVDSSGGGRFKIERACCEPHATQLEAAIPNAYM
jgi:hypothetical protein